MCKPPTGSIEVQKNEKTFEAERAQQTISHVLKTSMKHPTPEQYNEFGAKSTQLRMSEECKRGTNKTSYQTEV